MKVLRFDRVGRGHSSTQRSLTESDPEVIEAENTWAACTAEECYSLGLISDIKGEIDVRSETISVPIEQFDDEVLQAIAQEEILLAVADSTCRTESDFTDSYKRVLRRITEEALNETFDATG